MQPAFRDFARHHGFLPRLCRPYRAQSKGKVERFVRHLPQDFWVPLESRLRPLGLRRSYRLKGKRKEGVAPKAAVGANS